MTAAPVDRTAGQDDRGDLHVCDLDGTLLRSDATLSPFARDGLNQLLDAGLSLTVASARSAAAMATLLAGVRLRLPVVELNGAFLTDLATGRHLAHRTLDADTTLVAIETLEALGTQAVLTTWDGAADHVHFGAGLNAGATWYIDEKRAYGDPRLRPRADVRAVARAEHTAAVIAFVPDDRAERAVAELEKALHGRGAVLAAANRYVPGWSEVQVAHPEAEKGRAVRNLAEAVGMADARLTVYGDHLNDLPMFSVADRRVAPVNAHPDVLARATAVTAANDEDGVVRHLLREEGPPCSS
ncbi:HAD-IIB family hydrolase [Streptomyces sp. NPDC002688]|uniref:HAD-IIB family hydrolase n=1 Tax=Streptomyces sp. NPDC002688 TaxID=3154423 RepID=UPI00332E23FD